MTSTSKRRIIVNDIEYCWCIRGNDLECKGRYITIFLPQVNGRPLYLDPFSWGIEVRPKTVREAILYCLASGWNPGKKGKPLYLGYYEDRFIVLPEGYKSTSEYEESLNNSQ